MSKRPSDAPYPVEASSMEQVRDILFGAQLKDLETRFQRQEDRFTREINDARDALKKRLDSLENSIKNERTDRAEGLAKFNRALISLAETLESRLSNTTDTLNAVEQELRSLMLTERNTLFAKLEERCRETLNALQQDVVCRSVLSGILAEASAKLNNAAPAAPEE